MTCKLCKKNLNGGFKLECGLYKCADCSLIDLNVESIIFTNNLVFKTILQCLESKPTGRKYKNQVDQIKESLISARHLVYKTSEESHKLKASLK